MALVTLCTHLNLKTGLLKEIFAWLEEEFTNKEDKYLVIVCHGDSVLHSSLRLYTHIFPTELPDGRFQAARPIFFAPG
jgi:hypothetical protein